jgi:uncharacterized protein
MANFCSNPLPCLVSLTAFRIRGAASGLLLLLLPAFGLSAQVPIPGAPVDSEQVLYRNLADSTVLMGFLTLPEGPGPHPGVVLLSVAGTDPIVDHLKALGIAVLLPVRRGGLAAVETLLQASYAELGSDAAAALAYLRTRPDVDAHRIGLIGQADDAPAALLAVVEGGETVPLALIAPPAFPGREIFRLEQVGLALSAGESAESLERLERLVDRIVEIILGGESYRARASRLHALLATSDTRLPYNASFPTDEGQIHFFSSPIWYDRIAFEPESVLAQLPGPVLLLVGAEDAYTPTRPYLEAVRRGLAGAPSTDVLVCLLPGRTRHTFTPQGIAALSDWLHPRLLGHPTDTFPAGESLGCREPEPDFKEKR